MQFQDQDFDNWEMIPLKTLGEGAFGQVVLTKHPEKMVFYALKTVKKELIEKTHMQKHINQEREILLILDHPFIMKLVKTFKDAKRVYFLMEFVHG